MENNNDNKKQYLRGYEEAVRQMVRSEERIKEMRMDKICPVVILDGMPHGNSHSDLSGYAAMLDEEERKYMREKYMRLQKCKEIMDKVEGMTEEDEKDVLMYRYIRLLKWEDISARMNYSCQHIHRIHSKAIDNFRM